MALNISVAAEPVFNLGPLAVTNSMLTSWVVSLLLIGFALWFSRQSLKDKPKGGSIQNLVEMIIGGFYSFFTTIVGEEKTKKFFPLAATLFFFILFSNWFGLLPGVGSLGVWEIVNGTSVLVPIFRAATADINTTLALAIITVCLIQYYGLQTLGIKYVKKFLNFSSPINFSVGILDFVQEFTKIISFAFRLFGNIFAGEVLLTVMAFILPIVAPLPFLGLEIFVGLIQALVFVMLTLVFLGVATEKHH
ncbi:ATP synthase F0 subunit A [Candidatus Beckwithbacteria bacterium RBG_13_42_9]|uniref:ATP synthase subunit a n=1 Tax=Candidatus Beckwithbacteria bacterium RBG_13_42_9 TaxID=1797457 RepID=A0A1F5E8K0_9BACT|nr:MAG: ATP synthase F0 subunit A [Candidatus Beckwithbacteria bacterium RBG_13_42_9]